MELLKDGPAVVRWLEARVPPATLEEIGHETHESFALWWLANEMVIDQELSQEMLANCYFQGIEALTLEDLNNHVKSLYASMMEHEELSEVSESIERSLLDFLKGELHEEA